MEPTLLLVQILPLAVGIGWAIGKMPCWESWQGYVGLLIVAPVAIVTGASPGSRSASTARSSRPTSPAPGVDGSRVFKRTRNSLGSQCLR